MHHQTPASALAEDIGPTVEALTTLAMCHHGQIVALVAAVEAMMAVMSKARTDQAPLLAAHLSVCAQDHLDEGWHPDQRLAFDNQVRRLQTLLSLLQGRGA